MQRGRWAQVKFSFHVQMSEAFMRAPPHLTSLDADNTLYCNSASTGRGAHILRFTEVLSEKCASRVKSKRAHSARKWLM